MKSICIIGGGFCGTLAAVNLARLSRAALSVTIVNCQYPLGRGVAYGTKRPEHLLNVVARNMSAFPDLPSHFVDWLKTRTEFSGLPESEIRERFIPRRIYGDYLQSLLFWHSQPPVAGRVTIQQLEGEVVDVEPSVDGGRVALSDGSTLVADRVLLATGNRTPNEAFPVGAIAGHPAYCVNPWQIDLEQVAKSHDDVLLVGTGLTMIDTFLTLRRLGFSGTTHAISRNGLLPLAHFKGSDYPAFPPPEPWTLGLAELAKSIEAHCGELRRQGQNPAILVDKLRPTTQKIWRSFSHAEKQAFCRLHRARWNITRHRIPPDVAVEIDEALRSGTLKVIQGRVAEAQPSGTRIAVTIQPAGDAPPAQLNVGLLVNCTGPRESFDDLPDPLYRNLYRRGLVRSDELNLGLDVTPDFAVVDRAGQPSELIFAIGSLLKGTLWETTAVPELRAQAQQVAHVLLAQEQFATPEWMPETPESLIEYYI